MNEGRYLVTRSEGRWSILSAGRVFDRFEDKDDAVLTAVIQAENARREGRRMKVLVEENGRARAIWGEDAGPRPTATQSYPQAHRSKRRGQLS